MLNLKSGDLYFLCKNKIAPENDTITRTLLDLLPHTLKLEYICQELLFASSRNMIVTKPINNAGAILDIRFVLASEGVRLHASVWVTYMSGGTRAHRLLGRVDMYNIISYEQHQANSIKYMAKRKC